MNHHSKDTHHDSQTSTPTNNTFSFKNFLPLITIVSVIFVATGIKQIGSPQVTMYNVMNDFMGIFFVVFGSFKIMNLQNFAEAYSTYDLIAQRSRIYALAYPFIELGMGGLYLLHWYPITTLWITTVIMTISALGVINALLKKEQFVCACLGTVFKIPMTYVTLLEDVAMVIMALIMLATRNNN